MRPLLKFALFFALIFLLPGSLTAGVELAGWYSSGWPRGKLSDYGYGVITTGGTARVSWAFGEKSSTERFFFTEFGYADFGVETGYQVPDPQNPALGMDAATDLYWMMFSSGISLGKRFPNYRVYSSFFGGVSYYSALSRISSHYRIGYPVELLSESRGMTWHAGIGAGIKILVWNRQPSSAEHLLDEVFLDIKADYTRGGHTEYLNWRSIRDEAGAVGFDNWDANIDFFQLSFGLSLVF